MEVYIIIAIAIIIFIIIKLLNDKKRNYEKLVKQIKVICLTESILMKSLKIFQIIIKSMQIRIIM